MCVCVCPSRWSWRQVLLVTEADGQQRVAGRATCHLMMKTLANFLKGAGLRYTPWDASAPPYLDGLQYYAGRTYAGT